MSCPRAQRLRFIVQYLVKNTSLEAGLLALQIKIPSGIHLLGSSEGGICFEFIFWSLRLLSLATLVYMYFFLCTFMFMSVCVLVCLFMLISESLSVYLSVCLSVCLSGSVCLSVFALFLDLIVSKIWDCLTSRM